MIKIIAEHINSKRDLNGNCYWFTIVTNCKTNKELRFNNPHYSNAESSIRKAGFENEQIKNIYKELPIREFNRKSKFCTMNDSCNDPKIVKAIKSLNKKEVK